MMHLTFEPEPNPGEVEAVRQALREFNGRQIGYRGNSDFAIFVRDDAGRVRGGVLCFTLWQWLTIDWLWLDESIRGQGFGGQLLVSAEAEGQRRGCQNAYVETLSFQAPEFYQKHGYQIVGELKDFPAGHSRYFLQKLLSAKEKGGIHWLPANSA
jgi:GNAT superfamily N-acetyltransferase